MRAHLARANTVRGLVIPRPRAAGGGWAAAVVARDDQARERWVTLLDWPPAGGRLSWDDAAAIAHRAAFMYDLLGIGTWTAQELGAVLRRSSRAAAR